MVAPCRTCICFLRRVRVCCQNDERRSLRQHIQGELRAVCASLLDIVTKKLLVGAEADSLKKTEGLVFFLKMAGDYHRYMTELEVGEERTAQVQVVQHSLATWNVRTKPHRHCCGQLRYAAGKYEQASKVGRVLSMECFIHYDSDQTHAPACWC